jgi:hypothetical protein
MSRSLTKALKDLNEAGEIRLSYRLPGGREVEATQANNSLLDEFKSGLQDLCEQYADKVIIRVLVETPKGGGKGPKKATKKAAKKKTSTKTAKKKTAKKK